LANCKIQERLGSGRYGASALEGGFRFLRYFLNANHQCAHDRLAGTIAVREQRGIAGI
jgi:hypothetical protein